MSVLLFVCILLFVSVLKKRKERKEKKSMTFIEKTET